MFLSLVVPLYNEEDNVLPLVHCLIETMEDNGYDFEVILVNDGSFDSTGKLLDEVSEKDKRLKIVHFRFNCGQTTALMAGFDFASGDVIVTLDGDLQNDPADIPMLLAELDKGYDVCSGWRKNRKDAPVRVLFSRIANKIISFVSGIKLNDYGCTLKAYRKEILKDFRLYGEMHRFIPIYTSWCGARVSEIPVNHNPRIRGRSKYGMSRVFKVILDLIVIKFFSKYYNKPIYLFGFFGFINFLLSFISFVVMVYYKYWGGKSFVETPIPMLVVLFFVVGMMSLFMGILAEVQMRTYYESQQKCVYLVKAVRNIKKKD
jgi:glycosyltransferase involved in cell wall biosynthesis